MIRTLDLERWAGRWVAVGRNGIVQVSAETLGALIAEVDDRLSIRLHPELTLVVNLVGVHGTSLA